MVTFNSRFFALGAFVFVLPLIAADLLLAAEPQVIRPLHQQVVQRRGYVPAVAKTEGPTSPAFGFADVAVEVKSGSVLPSGTVVESRAVLHEGASGRSTDWRPIANQQVIDAASGHVSGETRIPAGGWYRLELRGRQQDQLVFQTSVERLGIGEVFLIAGQSYATNTNDEKLRIADPQERVTAYDSASLTWRLAHDPQPAPDNTAAGSIWPPLGDALVNEFQVPIGFANVAWGATASASWLPGQMLHQRLTTVGKTLGTYRAVLWQQGESDVIAQTTTEQYVKNLTTIRQGLVDGAGFSSPWLLAKSTHHPTVYQDPVGEGRIRTAIDELAKLPGFKLGPDTDSLQGENRGGPTSQRHFSAIGQRRAAEMWLATVRQEIELPRPAFEAALGVLTELRLLEPAWLGNTVYRESGVLLQDGDRSPTVRLAFKATQLLEVATADRRHVFRSPDDFTLSADGRQLVFRRPDPINPIPLTDFFLPAKSPHSYQYRAGKPEEWMLYRPGRWFHDHNVEVTYRHEPLAEIPVTLRSPPGSLPKTKAKLQAKQPFTIGISGDSISTGLDASGLTHAAPFQLGFAELVAAQIQDRTTGDIKYLNRAVAGWSVANGNQDLDTLLEVKPDLIIVAYGMNDVGRRDPQWFGQQTQALIDRVRAANPATEIVLVSPMLGNPEWQHTPREMFAQYRDALSRLTCEGVMLADVTAAWELFMTHKHHHDMTGNGLNHPNDFGHRLYAQVVLACLLGGK